MTLRVKIKFSFGQILNGDFYVAGEQCNDHCFEILKFQHYFIAPQCSDYLNSNLGLNLNRFVARNIVIVYIEVKEPNSKLRKVDG